MIITFFFLSCASKETVKTADAGKTKSTAKNADVNLLQSGIDAYKAREYDKAKDLLSKAVKEKISNDDQLTAHKHLAFINALQGNADGAYKQFMRAFKLDKGFELNKSETGHPAWTPAFERAKKEAAILYAKGADLFENGKSSYSKREYDNAVKFLEAAVSKEDLKVSKKVEAYKFLAFIYAVQKNPSKARTAFTHAFKLDKEFQLDKSEYGNPVWTPLYEEAKKQFTKK
jgi:Tfp pilus assembly protein PilF